VIEVKGGGIIRDGTGWFSIDSGHHRHPIDDPFEQAKRSAKALSYRLQQEGSFGLKIGHAVIFPDSDTRTETLRDKPAGLVSWLDDMERLRPRLTLALESFDGTATLSDIGAAVRILDGIDPCQVDVRFGALIGGVKRHITKLTEEQFWKLGNLKHIHRAAISGGAGTGKTVLALELARGRAAEGDTTLLLCYNEELGRYLKGEWSDGVCRTSLFAHTTSLPRAPAGMSGPCHRRPRKRSG
jgi:hypothetical protein